MKQKKTKLRMKICRRQTESRRKTKRRRKTRSRRQTVSKKQRKTNRRKQQTKHKFHTNDSETNETNDELRNENVDENDTLFTDETLTKTSETPTENSRQLEIDATSLGLQGEQATEQAGIQVNDTVPPRAIASTPQPASAGTLPVAPARRGRGRPRKTDQQKEKSNDGPNAERQEKTDGKIAQPTRYRLRQSIKIPKKLTY